MLRFCSGPARPSSNSQLANTSHPPFFTIARSQMGPSFLIRPSSAPKNGGIPSADRERKQTSEKTRRQKTQQISRRTSTEFEASSKIYEMKSKIFRKYFPNGFYRNPYGFERNSKGKTKKHVRQLAKRRQQNQTPKKAGKCFR